MGLNIGDINGSCVSIKNSFKRIIKQETLLDDPRSRRTKRSKRLLQNPTPWLPKLRTPDLRQPRFNPAEGNNPKRDHGQ